MRNIIEELYYGNICPMDRKIVKGGEYSHLLHLLSRNEDNLTCPIRFNGLPVSDERCGQFG